MDTDELPTGPAPDPPPADRAAPTRMAPVLTARQVCYACGYSLVGLALPARCPECGRLADPAAELRRAREWFARQRLGLAWLWRAAPLAVPFVLDDAESRRLARRRIAVRMFLPAVLITVFSALTMSVETVSEVRLELTSTLPGIANRTLIAEVRRQGSKTYDDTLIAAENLLECLRQNLLELHNGQWRRPTWERQTGPTRVRLAPPVWHSRAAEIPRIVWVLLVFGVLPASFLLWCRARKAELAGELGGASRGLMGSLSLAAGPAGVGLWLLLAAAAAQFLHRCEAGRIWDELRIAAATAGGVLLALSVIACGWRMTALDHTRRLYPRPLFWGIGLTVVILLGMMVGSVATLPLFRES